MSGMRCCGAMPGSCFCGVSRPKSVATPEHAPVQYLVWGFKNTKSIDRLLSVASEKGLALEDAKFISRPTDYRNQMAVGFGWYEDDKPRYRIAVSLDSDKMTTRDPEMIEHYLRDEFAKRKAQT